MYHRILFPFLMPDRAGATDHTKKLSEIERNCSRGPPRFKSNSSEIQISWNPHVIY